MQHKPKISLVMKVYNGEQYLCQAIDSILNQTFRDFELLIIDDGSTDHSVEKIQNYKDERIRFLQNERNMGLCITQNKVIGEARGEYIAVMDCDDISYPERFQKQVDFLDSHPEIIMCGSFRNDIVDGQEMPFQEIRELSPESLRFSLVFGNYFFTHSSIMFRAEEYRLAGIQYGRVPIAEDYGVIVDMAGKYPVGMIPERLMAYRIYSTSTSKTKAKELNDAACQIKCDQIKNIPISEESRNYLLRYFRGEESLPEFDRFTTALQETAVATGADISKEGNAYPVACMLAMEYIMSCKKYNMTLWKQINHSVYKDELKKSVLLWGKILAACCIGYHRT